MKIVVSAGGTGGHIYPALAIINALKKEFKNLEVLYIGTKNRMESEIIPNMGIPYQGLEIYGFSKNVFKDLKNVFCIKSSLAKCKKIFKEFKPDLVLGFGGYVTYPVLKTAKKLKIKTFMHEQNSIVGKTNKALSKDIDLVAVSFLSTMDKFKSAKKVIYSGNPCAEASIHTKEIKKSDIGFDNKKKLVVAVAGSLGSSTLNAKLKEFLRLAKKSDYQVLYITGKKYYEDFIKDTKFPSNVKVMPYLDNLAGLLKNTDLIITRAGASTMSEILALNVPAIFIPSPYVAGNHQYYNALEIVKENAGLMLEESDLTSKKLFEMVNGILNDTKKYKIMKNNLQNLGKCDSSKLIVEAIKELTHE